MMHCCGKRRRLGSAAVLVSVAAWCVAANWFMQLKSIAPSQTVIGDRLLEVIEEEIDKSPSPHSKIAALANNQLARYADEMDLIHRMPPHLFEASTAICSAVCDRKCDESQRVFHRSALCRCERPFRALHNISITNSGWGEVATIDIDQKGKMMEVCSALMTCRSTVQTHLPRCAAQADDMLFSGKGVDREALTFQEMALQVGPKSVRDLFDFIATITYGEHSTRILASILQEALREDAPQPTAEGDFIDLGCGRGKMIAGAIYLCNRGCGDYVIEAWECAHSTACGYAQTSGQKQMQRRSVSLFLCVSLYASLSVCVHVRFRRRHPSLTTVYTVVFSGVCSTFFDNPLLEMRRLRHRLPQDRRGWRLPAYPRGAPALRA